MKSIATIPSRNKGGGTHYIKVITTARVSRTTEQAAQGPTVARVSRLEVAAARLVLEPLPWPAVAEVER
jgi:hypothetical protein